MIARQLARLSVQLYASPRYLELAGEPAHPADLARHECIGVPKVGPWVLHRNADIAKVEGGGRFLLNSVGMCRRLAILDLGIIMLPEEIAQEDVAAGRLRKVLPAWTGHSIPVYAITETCCRQKLSASSSSCKSS